MTQRGYFISSVSHTPPFGRKIALTRHTPETLRPTTPFQGFMPMETNSRRYVLSEGERFFSNTNTAPADYVTNHQRFSTHPLPETSCKLQGPRRRPNLRAWLSLSIINCKETLHHSTEWCLELQKRLRPSYPILSWETNERTVAILCYSKTQYEDQWPRKPLNVSLLRLSGDHTRTRKHSEGKRCH